MEDSNIKSLLIGRLGSAVTTIVAALALFGVEITPDDVTTITNLIEQLIHDGWGLSSLGLLVVSTFQGLYSKYKPRK